MKTDQYKSFLAVNAIVLTSKLRRLFDKNNSRNSHVNNILKEKTYTTQ